jgi:hypothetical protein
VPGRIMENHFQIKESGETKFYVNDKLMLN